MIALADIGEEASILDNFWRRQYVSGHSEKNPGQRIVGQEINPIIYDFALVYLYCLDATNTEVFTGRLAQRSSFINEKFDRVITECAALGLRADHRTWEAVAKRFL